MRIQWLNKVVSFVTLVTFMVLSVAPSYAQTVLLLPEAGKMVSLSTAFNPVVLRGMKVDAVDPFKFDFLVDPGDTGLEGDAIKDESTRLIRYFMAAMTTPEKDVWVNLSPYEQDRIVPEAFGTTEMGRDLLAQDYILKQITSSLMYPENEPGKAFWQEMYKQAYDKYGTTDVPLDTFNKVWIMPDKAEVYEDKGVAYIGESRLKVMLESDYEAMSHQKDMTESRASARDLAQEKNVPVAAPASETASGTGDMTKEVIRNVMLPVIEKEVNAGRNFAQLRQIYQSLILAAWYKKRLKDSIFSKVYADQNKVTGVDVEDKDVKQKIWAQYVEAFKKGAYNYIKEEYDQYTQELIPRKYFSGGFVGNMSSLVYTPINVARGFLKNFNGKIKDIKILLRGSGVGESQESDVDQRRMTSENWKQLIGPWVSFNQGGIRFHRDDLKVLKEQMVGVRGALPSLRLVREDGSVFAVLEKGRVGTDHGNPVFKFQWMDKDGNLRKVTLDGLRHELWDQGIRTDRKRIWAQAIVGFAFFARAVVGLSGFAAGVSDAVNKYSNGTNEYVAHVLAGRSDLGVENVYHFEGGHDPLFGDMPAVVEKQLLAFERIMGGLELEKEAVVWKTIGSTGKKECIINVLYPNGVVAMPLRVTVNPDGTAKYAVLQDGAWNILSPENVYSLEHLNTPEKRLSKVNFISGITSEQMGENHFDPLELQKFINDVKSGPVDTVSLHVYDYNGHRVGRIQHSFALNRWSISRFAGSKDVWIDGQWTSNPSGSPFLVINSPNHVRKNLQEAFSNEKEMKNAADSWTGVNAQLGPLIEAARSALVAEMAEPKSPLKPSDHIKIAGGKLFFNPGPGEKDVVRIQVSYDKQDFSVDLGKPPVLDPVIHLTIFWDVSGTMDQVAVDAYIKGLESLIADLKAMDFKGKITIKNVSEEVTVDGVRRPSETKELDLQGLVDLVDNLKEHGLTEHGTNTLLWQNFMDDQEHDVNPGPETGAAVGIADDGNISIKYYFGDIANDTAKLTNAPTGPATDKKMLTELANKASPNTFYIIVPAGNVNESALKTMKEINKSRQLFYIPNRDGKAVLSVLDQIKGIKAANQANADARWWSTILNRVVGLKVSDKIDPEKVVVKLIKADGAVASVYNGNGEPIAAPASNDIAPSQGEGFVHDGQNVFIPAEKLVHGVETIHVIPGRVDVPINVLKPKSALVVDISKSMLDNGAGQMVSSFEDLRLALKNFVVEHRPEFVVFFRGGAPYSVPKGADGSIDAMLNYIQTMSPDGNTNIDAGIEKAFNLALGMNIKGLNIMLITDGGQTDGLVPVDVNYAVKMLPGLQKLEVNLLMTTTKGFAQDVVNNILKGFKDPEGVLCRPFGIKIGALMAALSKKIGEGHC